MSGQTPNVLGCWEREYNIRKILRFIQKSVYGTTRTSLVRRSRSVLGGMNSSAKLEEPVENTKAMVGKEMHIEPLKAEAWG